MKISPSDRMSAEVGYLGQGRFQLTITDVRTAATFTTTQKSASAQRSSAEWIVEAPWSGRVLPLADFVTVTFENDHATLRGHSGPIDDPAWEHDGIDMVASSGVIKARTSVLPMSGDGTSFSVKWYHW